MNNSFDRINALNNSNYFSLLVNNNIPAGTVINVAVESPVSKTVDSPIAKQIVEDGYVRNSKIHRRWITAHYMRMLNYRNGWHAYFNNHYGYMYQFSMMEDECKVLAHIRHKDFETYNERSVFFTLTVIKKVLADYLRDLSHYLSSLKVRSCRGRKYVRVNHFGDVFVEDIDRRIMFPVQNAVAMCCKAYNYATMRDYLMVFNKIAIDLPFDTKKSSAFVNAFQLEGAYYTLRNLIMFHDVKLTQYGRVMDMECGLETIKKLSLSYAGYQMNALLKETIRANNFDLARSIEEHNK